MGDCTSCKELMKKKKGMKECSNGNEEESEKHEKSEKEDD